VGTGRRPRSGRVA